MIAAATRIQRRRANILFTVRQVKVASRNSIRALHDTVEELRPTEEKDVSLLESLPVRRTSTNFNCALPAHYMTNSRIRIGFSFMPHKLLCQQRRHYGYNGNYKNSMDKPNGLGMTPEKILSYLESQNVNIGHYRQNGSHLILRECPFCSKPTGGKMDNLYKCYIRIDNGSAAFHCHRCGSGGSWYDLKKRLGDFEVESISQVARQGQYDTNNRPMSRAMSTVAAQATGVQWQASNFSINTSSPPPTSPQNQSSTQVKTPPLPDYTRRGYEGYLKPPNSHPNAGRAVAPLPMPAQRLQALYSTQLLDTPKPSAVRKYLTETRGINVKTLRKYGVGQASYKFPTDDNRWTSSDCVTFPWIMSVAQVERQETLRGSNFVWTDKRSSKSEDDVSNGKTSKDAPLSLDVKESTFITRRIKARSIENKAWQRMDPPGGGWGLFGWHTVPTDATELVITEGEYDAMAVYQATGRPAISLPNGCRSLPVEVLPLLEKIEKIYLWMDSDAAGQEGAETFSKKLGMERTYIVRPTLYNTFRLPNHESESSEEIQLPKDANEALLNGLDLDRIIEDSRLTPHERIMTFENLRDDVLQEILYPEKYVGTPILSLPGLTHLIQGFRRGELTVLTGPTGAGKTTFLGQVSLDLAEQGTNVLWGSFEIKNTRLMHKLLQQFARQPLPKGDPSLESQMNAIADRFQQLPMYFLTFHGGSDVDQVLEAMDYAGKRSFDTCP